MNWRQSDGVRWLEAELHGARAAFTTRVGGVSAPPFDRLNLGLLTGDASAAVRENRRRVAAAVGRDPSGFLLGHQVHGADLARTEIAPAPNSFLSSSPPLRRVDCQVTGSPELTPMVQAADCLPIALAGPDGVAIAHCGWRGLATGILARAVEETRAASASIGPGIRSCCYEVGPEVVAEFEPLGEDVASGRMLDLPEVARRLLAAAGVTEVEDAELCTSCEPELFYSHRRDAGRTGRQAGLAWIDDRG